MVSTVSCESDFAEVGRAVMNGDIVVFPTDTIYGVGTSPMSRTGIQKCFNIKERQMEKKLPVLFSGMTEAAKIVQFDKRAVLIAERFWPGQVTLVLPIGDASLPEELIGEDRTLAVRVPNHNCCLRLVTACGHSLIGTSANISGKPTFVDPDDHALNEFAKRADYFVKGGCGTSLLPSTILDITNNDHIAVLREGAVPVHEISAQLSKISNTDFSFKATKT
ncbi:MAG: threonylcarbamoyl-AMP synthase [Nitrososphaerota archaeon]|nr:threonylcarbamoyl-AMP synthase [Nitrososphaerota archaeon]MDG6924182.1 threonylcarbamoyl-AMP synthase [Nitrososphaerota archaeon]